MRARRLQMDSASVQLAPSTTSRGASGGARRPYGGERGGLDGLGQFHVMALRASFEGRSALRTATTHRREGGWEQIYNGELQHAIGPATGLTRHRCNNFWLSAGRRSQDPAQSNHSLILWRSASRNRIRPHQPFREVVWLLRLQGGTPASRRSGSRLSKARVRRDQVRHPRTVGFVWEERDVRAKSLYRCALRRLSGSTALFWRERRWVAVGMSTSGLGRRVSANNSGCQSESHAATGLRLGLTTSMSCAVRA